MHDKKLVNTINKTIVSAYKVMGFVVLTVILGALAAYLGQHGFFLTSRSWTAPTVISPSDEKVLGLNARAAAETESRERLVGEKRQLEARRADALRVAEAHADFVRRFEVAIRSDRTFRARELAKLRQLREHQKSTGEEFAEASNAFVAMAGPRAEALRDASLIDREALLTTNHQMAQIRYSNLLIAEKEVSIGSRMDELVRDLRAIDAFRDGKLDASAASLEVLRLQQELVRAELEHERATREAATIEETLAALERSIERYDRLLGAIRSSPYLKAVESDLTVVFVPYQNLHNVQQGRALYGCSFGLFWCRQVGTVEQILEGEVTLKHPIRNVILRGAMVEVHLPDPSWAQRDLLHLGSGPFFF